MAPRVFRREGTSAHRRRVGRGLAAAVPGEKEQPPAGERGGGCIGAGTRTRTGDLLITSQLLYQLSYAGPRRESPGPGANIRGQNLRSPAPPPLGAGKELLRGLILSRGFAIVKKLACQPPPRKEKDR